MSGGWFMAPLILCSIASVAIIAERLWTLQKKRICPENLVAQVWHWAKAGQLDANKISQMRVSTPLGRVLAAGLVNMRQDRAIMKEAIEETGRHVIHELERFLNTLGTIVMISPLLGLLGTVSGMIEIFSTVTSHGVGDAKQLAGGIGMALVTTAAGLMVAIPTLIFHRYFQRRIDDIIMTMEQEALKMVEVLQGERERDEAG